MFVLLLAAGTLYMLVGDLREGLTLFGFVVVTVALTLYQEGKTERAFEALRDLTSPRALVSRDGQPQRIAGRDVVRGDLLKLSEGDRVPADALLVTAVRASQRGPAEPAPVRRLKAVLEARLSRPAVRRLKSLGTQDRRGDVRSRHTASSAGGTARNPS
jgi:Ca2+-transporting ATPase